MWGNEDLDPQEEQIKQLVTQAWRLGIVEGEHSTV